MSFDLVTNIESCYVEIPALLYYSHIPTVILAVSIGLFIFFKARHSLASRLLLMIVVFFGLWSAADLILWLGHDSRYIMFFWSLINLLEVSVSMTTLYFAAVFLKQKDVLLRYKLIGAALLVPFIVLIPTVWNVKGFALSSCEAEQGPLTYYFYFMEAVIFLWLLGFLGYEYFHAKKNEEKRLTLIFGLGTILFLFSFSGANIIASYTERWEILQYGLFGMVVFIAFLGYLIVRYQVFDIKLLSAQALIISLVVIIGSQLFFVKTPVNFVLTLIGLFLIVVAGYMLTRSVKLEVRRKEELQTMADELVVANDNLRQLDNAKSEFISIASHQLRTPLTAIKGFVSLLLEGSYGTLSPRVEDTLNKVYISNERLIHLVEDLLNLSRIESGRMEYHLAAVHIESLLKELYSVSFIIAKQKGLTLDLDLPKQPLPIVILDVAKMREVISNMIDNAIKYTEEGSVVVKAYLTEDSQHIRIAVKDTGIGIPQEELPNLFKKFSRGKDTSRLHANGTGLGLYVGKQMIEAMGGKIWVESPGANQGATFIVEIGLGQETSETK